MVVPGEQTVNKIKRVDVAGTKTWHDYDNASAHARRRSREPVSGRRAVRHRHRNRRRRLGVPVTGLPEAAANGAIHVYTVQEEAVEHYATVIDGTAIANTLDPKLNDIAEVKGTKTWTTTTTPATRAPKASPWSCWTATMW